MKKSTLLPLIFALLLANLTFANPTTSTLAPFDEVILSGNIDVLLVPGDTESVDIEEKEEKISVNVSGGVLKVKRKNPLKIKEYQQRPIQVMITYKVLRRVKAAAGAEVNHRSTISGDQLKLDFNSGSHGNFEVDMGMGS